VSRPYLIGLTGGIGSGKSTAAAELAALGAEVISGDELGRQVLESSRPLLAEIRFRFGADVFNANGTLNRRILGDRVFGGTDDTRWLTQKTFPGIHQIWTQAVARSARAVIVLDAALIFEWGIESEFNVVVIVEASRQNILQRMTSSGRLTAAEIEARLSAQIPPEVKAQKADVVLANDGSPEEFREKVHEFWKAHVEPELQQRR
jgi:dephospho-CoA kinase